MSKKELLGSDIASIIMDRQAASVRSFEIKPKLVIIRTNDDPVTDVYLRIKQNYADSIGAEIEVLQTTEKEAVAVIQECNERTEIHGIIVQLPLKDPTKTDDILSAVSPAKDIDGLAPISNFDPATPTAILWLLASYNIDLRGKKVLVVGQGRLVGEPLTKMLRNSGVDVDTADENTKDLSEVCKQAQIIISAAGAPRIITADMIAEDAVVIDAGTTTDNGEVVGDVDESVRNRDDVIITPKRGGVGPLTVATLFENLLLAARNQSK